MFSANYEVMVVASIEYFGVPSKERMRHIKNKNQGVHKNNNKKEKEGLFNIKHSSCSSKQIKFIYKF